MGKIVKTEVTHEVMITIAADGVASLQPSLKPCPFCGGVEIAISYRAIPYSKETRYAVNFWCKNPKCGGAGGRSKYLETAIEKWNKRTV